MVKCCWRAALQMKNPKIYCIISFSWWILLIVEISAHHYLILYYIYHRDQHKAKWLVMVTVVSHDVFEGRQVAHWRLIAAEDLGARAKVVGKVLAVLLPHLLVSAQVVDLTVERHVVGRPVTCGTHRFSTTCSGIKINEMDSVSLTSAQCLRLVRILHQSRDLLHHNQRPVFQTAAQMHFTRVHNHVLIVIRAWRRDSARDQSADSHQTE